jgi:hypothetical protein
MANGFIPKKGTGFGAAALNSSQFTVHSLEVCTAANKVYIEARWLPPDFDREYHWVEL